MFGDVAFAQAPFAALGGATVLSSVDEAATAADSVAQETRAGALIQETIAAAELQEVNPFDQPAVEDGKKLALEYLRTA